MSDARNPQTEAQARVGEQFTARVLEPSPPAVTTEPFADDPPAGTAEPGTRLLTPADGSWSDYLAANPDDADWAAERWLGSYRQLGAPPDGFATARARLHHLAANVITPARYRATGKIGLRFTAGGFGTPFFGDDEQVRVVGDVLIVQRAGTAASAPLSTLGAAARAALGQDGADLRWAQDLQLHDVPAEGQPEDDLTVDAAAAGFLGDWFGFAFAVLERLRADGASEDASRPQIWPEHFDAAIEVLPGQRRASYGFSPGDAGVPEPYVYVSLWYAGELGIETGTGLWNATSFPGALLRLSELQGSDDQIAATLDWLRARRDALATA